MRRTFLADALDHWKGSLIHRLQTDGVLADFAIDPMFSDPDDWSPSDRAVFARLLHVSRDQFIEHSEKLADRRRYIAEIEHTGDLFLDPDTGIATGAVTDRSKYLFASEVRELLAANPSRLLMVYQHGDRTGTPARVRAVLSELEQSCAKLRSRAYISATAAMESSPFLVEILKRPLS